MSQAKVAIRENRLIESFHRYGWIALFWAICFGFYSQAMYKKSKTYSELQEKILDLESLKIRLKSEHENLALQIQSQNDPEWIEMILKQRLGVVSEGQMKVYFKKEE